MEWLKKTAGKVNNTGRHPRSAAPARVATGRFDVNPEPGVCCPLGGRHDGTFGEDDTGWELKKSWQHYAHFSRELDLDKVTLDPRRPSESELRDQSGSAELDEKDTLLFQYLSVFNRGHQQLNVSANSQDMLSLQPGEQTNAPPAMQATSPTSPLSPTLPVGHPHAAVTGVCKAAAGIEEHFRKYLTTGSSESLRLVAGFLVHLEILSRFDGNRQAMISHDFAGPCGTILLAVVEALTGESTPAVQSFCHRAARLLLVIFQRCADPDGQWVGFAHHLSSQNTIGHHFETSHIRRPWRHPLAHNAVRSLVSSVLRLQYHLRPSEGVDAFATRLQCLNMLACLSVHQASTVCTVLGELPLLEQFLCLTGCPLPSQRAQETSSDTKQTWDASAALEYRCQIHGFLVIKHLFIKQPEFPDQLCREGWCNRLTELLIWVASLAADSEPFHVEAASTLASRSTMSIGPARPRSPFGDPVPAFDPPKIWSGDAGKWPEYAVDEYPPPSPVCLTSPLDFFLKILETSLAEDFSGQWASSVQSSVSGFGTDLPNREAHQENISEVVVNQAVGFSLKLLLQAVAMAKVHEDLTIVALFKEHPVLQFAFLRFVGNLLRADGSNFGSVGRTHRTLCLQWMNSLDVWESLVGEDFYLWAAQDQSRASQPPAVLLRNKVMHVLSYGAGCTEDVNDQACQALLSLLQSQCNSDAGAVYDSCGALCAILRAQRAVTQEAFRRLNTFDILVPIISRFADANSWEFLHPVIALLQSAMYGNTEMSVYAFASPAIMNLLLLLLSKEDLQTSMFAQAQILDIAIILCKDYPTYGRWGLSFPAIRNALPMPMTPPPMDLETTPELFKRYFECFPAVFDRSDRSALQLRLLQGIRRLLAQHRDIESTLKDALIKANAFQFLLSILSAKIDLEGESSDTIARSLVEGVIDTLVVLLQGDEYAKRVFRLLRGYDEILTRVCIKPARATWPGLLEGAFMLLADGETSTPVRVCNGDVLEFLARLYSHCLPPLRSQLLSRLADIAASHDTNKAVMHNSGTFSHFLRLVLPLADCQKDLADIMRLLAPIAWYSLTVAEVKLLLQCLRRRNMSHDASSVMTGTTWSAAIGGLQHPASVGLNIQGGAVQDNGTRDKSLNETLATGRELPVWYDALVHTLLEIAQKQHGDLDFFAFDGTGGMIVPGLAKWPPGTSGWSFVTWIRLEDPIGKPHVNEDGRILTLRTPAGDHACEISVQQQELAVAVTRAGRRHVTVASGHYLAYGQWQCVVITHTQPKFPWSNASEIIVYIDSDLTWKGKLEFPEATAYSVAFVGASQVQAPGALARSSVSQSFINSFTGQLTSLYLFEDVLVPAQVASVFSHGPSVASHLGRERSFAGENDIAPTLPNLGRVLLEFHPLATIITPVPGEGRRRSTDGGAITSGVTTCGTKSLQTAIHALGGIGILVPILAQVDLLGGNVPNSSSPTDSHAELTVIRKLRTASFFELLACVTRRDHGHRQAFATMNGPRLVGSLLQQNDYASLGIEVFQALTKFLEATSSHAELCSAVEENLLFDIRIWAQTPAYVQAEYLPFVHELLTNRMNAYARRFGVSFWIDVLERWYRTTPSASKPEGTSLLSANDLTAIRREILAIVHAFLVHDPSSTDLDRFVRTLTIMDDPSHVSQCLMLVLDISTTKGSSEAAKLTDRLLHHGAAEVFLQLLQGPLSEGIPVLVLQLHAVMFSQGKISEKWKRRLRMEDLTWLQAVGLSSASIHPPGPALLARILAPEHFSRDVYHSLLQLSVEHQIVRWNVPLATSNDTDKNIPAHTALFTAPLDLRPLRVRNPGYLQAILDLCAHPDTPTQLTADILRDLLVLTARNPNGERARKSLRWQPAFLALLPQEVVGLEKHASMDEHAGLDSDTTSLANLIFKALTAFTIDSFDRDRKAWRVVEETITYAYLMQVETNADITIRRYLTNLLAAIRGQSADNAWRNFSAAKMENIVHLLFFVEEYMFHHHSMLDALGNEVRSQDTKQLRSVLRKSDLLDNVVCKSVTDNDDVRISFPLGECRILAEECLELLSCLLDAGVAQVRLEDAAEKSHTRTGGLIRLAIRILLSGLSVPEEATWHLTVRHLIPLLDKHASTFSEQKRDRGLYVLGHIHEAYVVAQGEPEDHTSDPRVLLPLYILALGRWRDVVAGLVDKAHPEDGSIVSDQLLSEALADQDIFCHLVSSPVWAGVFDAHLFPVMRVVEEEQFAFVPLVARRFTRAARTLLNTWTKEQAAVDSCLNLIQVVLQNSMWRRREAEARAKMDWDKSAEMDRRYVARELCSLWRNLTLERGIWNPYGTDSPQQIKRWKMDRAENNLRMRRRLTVNWEFDSHQIAASKRDKTFKPDPSASPKLSRGTTLTSLPDRKVVDRRDSTGSNDLLKSMNAISLSGASLIPEDDADIGEDEWSILNEEDLHGMYSIVGANGNGIDAKQRLIYSAECEMILLMTPVKGRLDLTPTHLLFTADIKATTASLCESERDAVMALMTDNRAWLKERAWPLADLRDTYLRRYMLRRSAVELFFLDKTSHLFNFAGAGKLASKDRLKFLKALVACKPPNLRAIDLRSTPPDLVKRSNMPDRWAKREISNFEYLMWLNTVSGRTYNDLTQYPVFPWILRDYQSDTLDLTDNAVYRDLSKPIGAVDDTRLQGFLARYEAFEDPSGVIKKFHYGTHYSSAASVLFYLLRLEPFTSLHVGLQSGKFDHPDRQFHAIQGCWKSVSTGAGDVKELIPEFFYMPEFLRNENDFDLGTKQTGEVLGDVLLPPWAKSYDEFIRIHREALEGDYVSEHLNEWIDLIWGYKQTGEEAIKAYNVFYYLTYEGAINIDAIKDPMERRSIEDQINNFGQTPSQLFKKPHPRRSMAAAGTDLLKLFRNPQNHRSYLVELKGTSLLFVAVCRDERRDTVRDSVGVGGAGHPAWSGGDTRLVTVDSSQLFRAHHLSCADDGSFLCELDQAPIRNRKLPFQLASTFTPHTQLYAVTRDGRTLVAGGCWDCSFRIMQLDANQGQGSPRTVEIIYGHRDIVTCLALGEDGRTIVTGSRDTTVMSWEIDLTAQGNPVARNRRKVFCGHDEAVTDVAVNVEHGLVVSGSSDGTVILHTLYDGSYLRTLSPLPQKPDETLSIRRVLVTVDAAVIVYSEVIPREHVAAAAAGFIGEQPSAARRGSAPALGGVCYLHAFSVNGRPTCSRMFPTRLKAVTCSADGAHLVVADDRGGISLLKSYNFHILHRFDVSVSVTSIAISLDQRHFFLGRKDGRMLVLEHDPKPASRASS